MKIKVSQIVESVESIKSIQEVKLPVKIAYRIKRLVDKLAPILKSYEEKRVDLVKEMGEETKDGQYQVSADKIKAFMSKLGELQSVDEEIEFEPIKISEIGEATIQAKDLVDFIFSE